MPQELTFSLPDVDSIDQVPEEYRPLYFEKEGKVQKQNPAAMASTMAKIRRDNEKTANELLEAQNTLASYRDVFGDDAPDLDEIKALRAKAARADELPTDQEVEKRIKLVEENFKKQLALKDSDIKSRELTIEKVTISGMLKEALRAADANTDGLDLLPDIMRKRVEKVIEADGSVKLHPLDEDGTRMYAEDGSEATLVDLANEFRNKRPIFFNGSGARGTGSNGEAAVVPAGSKDWYKMSPQEKADFRKKHGPAAARALMQKSSAPAGH